LKFNLLKPISLFEQSLKGMLLEAFPGEII